MKKFLALILALVMMVPLGIFASSAASGDGYCFYWDSTVAYGHLQYSSSAPTDSIIEFDAVLLPDTVETGKEPNFALWDANNAEIKIAESYVSYGTVKNPFKWGNLAWTNWRHIKYQFLNGTITLSIDDQVVLNVSGGANSRTNDQVIFSYAGELAIDNLHITNSAGRDIKSLNFTDANDVANMFSDSLGERRAVGGTGCITGLVDVKSAKFSDAASVSSYVVAGSSNTTPVEVTYGDMNADGKINIRDSLTIKLYMAGKIDEPTINLRNADITKDGDIKADDLLALRLYFVGKRTSLPATETIYVPVEGGTGTGTASAEYDTTENALKITATAADPSVYFDLSTFGVTAADYKCFTLVYKIPSETSGAVNGEALPCAGTVTKDSATAGTTATLTAGAKYYVKSFDFTSVSGYSGNVNGVVFKPEIAVGEIVYVDSIYLSAEASDTTASTAPVLETRNAGSGPITGGAKGEYEGNNYVIRFDSDDKASIVSNSNNSSVGYNGSESALKCQTTASGDPSVYADLKNEGISASTFKYITYVYKIPTTTQRSGPQANFYYVCNDIDVPTGGYESDIYSLTKNDRYCYAVVDLSAKTNWNGAIKGLRMDYFTDASVGDIAYVDSIIFAKSEADAKTAGNARINSRNPIEVGNIQDSWNAYWGFGPSQGDTYVLQSGTTVYLYFRYGSGNALTQTSIANRLAASISETVNREITAEVYTGFIGIKSQFNGIGNGGSCEGTMQFTLTDVETGKSYCVWVQTVLLKTSGFTSPLDGDATTEPDPSYPSTSTWYNDSDMDVSQISDVFQGNGLAVHSNHENRLLRTAHGTFAVIPTGSLGEFGAANSATFEIFKINDDGSYYSFYSTSFRYHTSKPNIYEGYDGKVYVVVGDAAAQTAEVGCWYFDPSAPTSSGSYNVTQVRQSIGYPGGSAPGGYGYSQPVIDNANSKIYIFFNGGSTSGDLCWFIFNQATKSWQSSSYHVGIDYRHAYIYGYADGTGRVYIVFERDVLLSSIGLAGIVYGADYAWDELALVTIPNVGSANVYKKIVSKADYSQAGRNLFPILQNNSMGDTYLDSNGYIHVLYTKIMHGNFHHDTKYYEMWNAVLDTNQSKNNPVEIYNKPIRFINEDNHYAFRMCESTSGQLYILAHHYGGLSRLEIFKADDAQGKTFTIDGVKAFDYPHPTDLSIIITNNRNNSIIDNTIGCMYPKDDKYRYFTVKLPA